MENNIAAFYKDFYDSVILLDTDLKVAYKNDAAKTAKMKPRVGIHIKKYLNEDNLKYLKDISDGKADSRIIELKDTQEKCLARISDGMTVLIFFDSLNYMKNYAVEKAVQINKIMTEYKGQELLYSDGRDNKKIQKIRSYLRRHIENFKKERYEKNYCNIWEFINYFEKGVSAFINKLGYKITFTIDAEDKLFIYRLNESDFLTLNFILLSYALSSSVFGNLNIKFDPDDGSVIYEFIPVSNCNQSGNENTDLKLAELIAANNNLKIEFLAAENNINSIEEKMQIMIRFISSGELSHAAIGSNILTSEYIEVRAEIELAFLQANLNNFSHKFV